MGILSDFGKRKKKNRKKIKCFFRASEILFFFRLVLVFAGRSGVFTLCRYGQRKTERESVTVFDVLCFVYMSKGSEAFFLHHRYSFCFLRQLNSSWWVPSESTQYHTLIAHSTVVCCYGRPRGERQRYQTTLAMCCMQWEGGRQGIKMVLLYSTL